MNKNLAPRPPNEELRAKAVVKTGLIDAPKPEMFQVYCDLAKEITGFKYADFSLFDGEVQCNIANAGDDDFESGTKDLRHEFNICSYVLLDPEPLIMHDLAKDPTWKTHPKILDGTAEVRAYAGFPVINRDNYALGTLCISHPKPMHFPEDKINLIKIDTNGSEFNIINSIKSIKTIALLTTIPIKDITPIIVITTTKSILKISNPKKTPIVLSIMEDIIISGVIILLN